MGLRDAFRSRRKSEESEPVELPVEVDEPDFFRPRIDGEYEGGADPDDAARTLILQFSHSRVTEPNTGAPAGGEYTTSGRFTVQAPFERAVVFTVLTVDEDSFTARRTATGTGTSTEQTYQFRPADQA